MRESGFSRDTAVGVSDADTGVPFTPLAPARRSFVTKAVSDGRRMGLATQFFEGVSKEMRELGASWMPLRRMWVVPVDEMRALLEGVAKLGRSQPSLAFDDARDKAALAWHHPVPDFFVSLFDVQLLPLASGGFACTSIFDVVFTRAMRKLGGRFHKFAAAWEIKTSKEQILDVLRRDVGLDEVFVFVHDSMVQLENLVAPPKAGVPIKVMGAPPPHGGPAGAGEVAGSGFLSAMGTPMERLAIDEVALANATETCGLRDYQVVGVRHLLGLTSALLADDMGLGKTRQAIVAAHLASLDTRILVVCPASLCLNWQREIQTVFPEQAIGLIGEHSMDRLRDCRWIIANYERLGGLVRETTLSIGTMLIDEAHYLKEHQAGRTRNAFLLAERIPRRFLLTGTPVLSREIEVHTLLRLSGHPIGQIELADFRERFAGAPERRAELASRLSEWMLRRGKDVLTDLGDKTQQVRYVRPADGMAGYEAIMKDMTLQSMPKITKLRQHLESLKVDFIVESIECLAQDAKAIVFCEYMDTVEALREAFKAAGIGCVSLVGSDAPKKRMKAIDEFQANPNVRVFIGTTMAAGVGITLTAANYVFFASLPWTPALKRQAEDRAYRSGQRRDVFVIIPVVAGTIDEQVFALLGTKKEIEDDIVESLRTPVAAQ
jgi:superfamily II DNA or RNA helicase